MKNLPKKFLQRLSLIYPDNYNQILQNFDLERIGSFRINNLKSSEIEVLTELKNIEIEVHKFSANHNIYIFDKKFEYQIKWSSSFYNGKIYLQSIASMLPVLAMDPQQNQKILDVCSAPGGKTTQIADLTNNSSEIFAIEQNQIRFDKLNYNIALQWAKVQTFKTDARKFLTENKNFFDKILLDAPCSAEGRIFLKNEKTFGFWSEKNILNKAKLQNELLELSWQKLKKWWILVYSTCTIAPEENEILISDFLQKFCDSEILPIEIGLEKEDFWMKNIENFEWKNFANLKNYWVRILPTKLTEWFFMVKIMKK